MEFPSQSNPATQNQAPNNYTRATREEAGQPHRREGKVTARVHASLDDLFEEQERKLAENVLPGFLSEEWPRLRPAMDALAAGQTVLREL
ncbi:hypothetical protein [Pyxidicoccus xibeiensis]|uniref:hypothetical protein n=1 Tax=Pyxidicoccus xibeiensis TaxID=2906759 RepID=UPI0020A71E64|nr:hypothetical protein [Pyxidicoccus xibeiensis]MCP3142034.1 hypothetical protein [Pyxidicoccus xibeiensis]